MRIDKKWAICRQVDTGNKLTEQVLKTETHRRSLERNHLLPTDTFLKLFLMLS